MLSEEDEAGPQSDHSVELITETQSPFPSRRRRMAMVAVGACMLGAVGLIALAVVEHQRAAEEERTLEGVQSASLQDGWKTLGAVAAQGAQQADAQNAPSTAAAQPPPAAPTTPAPANVVIVNVPSQAAPAAPAGGTSTGQPMAQPSVSMPNTSTGSNTVYVPTPVLQSNTPNGNIPGQNVSNGASVGSQSNPGLPNGSSSTQSPTPGLPNGSVNTTPPSQAQPVGGVPASPPSFGITP